MLRASASYGCSPWPPGQLPLGRTLPRSSTSSDMSPRSWCGTAQAVTTPSDPKGGLDLTSRGTALAGGESQLPAIAPKDPENSYLLTRIRSGEMPPEGKGQAGRGRRVGTARSLDPGRRRLAAKTAS